MKVSTTNDIPGCTIIKHIGIARGITVRSRSALGNLAGGIQSLFGGKLTVFVSLAETARQEAFDHLVQHATEAGQRDHRHALRRQRDHAGHYRGAGLRHGGGRHRVSGAQPRSAVAMRPPECVRRYETVVADSARWAAYRPRAGDIIVSTAPKCGTTWTQMAAALIVHGLQLPAPLTRLSPWLDRVSAPLEDVLAELDAQPWRRVIKTHTPLDGLPYHEEVSYLYCGRDPRDAFLSMMDNMKNASPATMAAVFERLGVPQAPFPEDPNQFFRVWMTAPAHAWVEDGFPTGSVFGAARAFWPHRGLANVHFLHYRDLTLDLECELRRLAAFLDIDVSPYAWPALIQAASFAAMKDQADDTAPGAHLGDWADNQAFFAKARLEAWREVLSAENQALYAELAPKRAPPPLRSWLEDGRALAGDPRLI